MVSFLDAEHQLDHDAYTAMWGVTEKVVADLMIMPADDASLDRQVAFVLSGSIGSTITFDP
jgi:hypothetical protein